MTPTARSRVATTLGVVGVLVVYAAGVWAVYHPLGLLDPARVTSETAAGCGCTDNGQGVWLLAAQRARLVTGHLPFFTTSVNSPAGVNLLETASFPLLATLAAPLTGAVGPTATLALLFRLGTFASAVAAFGALRRVGLRLPAAALGGAVYGFSPFMLRQGGDHLFLTWVPLPPLILLIVYRRLTGAGRPLAGGLAAGGLLAAQGLIDIELAASTVVMAVLAAGLIGIWRAVRRRPVRAGLAAGGRLASGAVLVAVPVLAYPAWYLMAGPQHISGTPSPPGAFAIGLLATLIPDGRTVVAGLWSGIDLRSPGFVTNMGFVGIPTLAVLVWIIVSNRRRTLVVAATVLGVVGWVLAIGPRLRLGRGAHALVLPLPFAVLDRLPVIGGLITNRFTLWMDLSMAVLLAVGADRVLAGLSERAASTPTVWPGADTRFGPPEGKGGRRGRWLVAEGAAVVAATVLILPGQSIAVAGTAGAPVWRTAAVRRLVPARAVVLAFPYPRNDYDQAQLWQAESGMRFDLVGGYAERPVGFVTRRLADGRLERVWDASGTKAPATVRPYSLWRLMLHTGTLRRPVVRRAETFLPGFVRGHRVTRAVVDVDASGSRAVVQAFTHVWGAPEAEIGADWIWRTCGAGELFCDSSQPLAPPPLTTRPSAPAGRVTPPGRARTPAPARRAKAGPPPRPGRPRSRPRKTSAAGRHRAARPEKTGARPRPAPRGGRRCRRARRHRRQRAGAPTGACRRPATSRP